MEMIQSIRAKWPTIRYKTLSWRIMQRDAELNDLIIVLFTLSLGYFNMLFHNVRSLSGFLDNLFPFE